MEIANIGNKITINRLTPRQNGRHFPDDIFKCIFLNENVGILITISLKFFTKWANHQYSSICSDKDLALSKRQAIIWTNDVWFNYAYMRHSASIS